MKLKYKYQSFQAEACGAVVRAFAGQPKQDGTATHNVDPGKNASLFNLPGFGNGDVRLEREQIAENVRAVQMEQGIKPIEYLEGEGLTFTIEMETGTGKTYTYIKTMYELHRRYGWSKFVIVVPSIAIREGVHKSLQSMEEHFALDYGERMQYFVYNSKRLQQIDAYASDPGMHVMIINTQAFNTSMNEEKNVNGRGGDNAARIIYSRRDEFGGRRPIDVLAGTHPIIIIDEPQSVLGADKGNATRKGLTMFKPLFTLLYSATHRKGDIYNMLYRLDAIDAYNRHLVKKIEVKGIKQLGSTATNGYVYLEEIVIGQGNPKARICFDQLTKTGIRQTTMLVDEGFNLHEQSGGLAEYESNFIVARIDGRTGTVLFLNRLELHEGDGAGKVNEDFLRRIQIRETIKTHLERERQLFSKRIKVLSLFFIDHVDSYRLYGAEDSRGKFARMFEEEYVRAVEEFQPSFGDEDYIKYLKDARNSADKAHQGYFAQDRSGKLVDSKEGRETERDESAFDLIMKDKERLLSLDEPVRFIFSHSALKEGWDNPNVFQICTLKNSGNETRKRQEVGRGMRLCVNSRGERQDADVLGDRVFDTNVLTIIASESYDDFARALQSEIASACESRPICVTAQLFEGTKVRRPDGTEYEIREDKAEEIFEALIRSDYVKKSQLTAKYFDDKKDGKLDFGVAELNEMREAIVKRLDMVFDPETIKPENSRDSKTANFNKANFDKKEFQELWKRINTRTYYRVEFDTEELIKKAIKNVDDNLKVTEIRLVVQGGAMDSITDREALEAGTAMKAGGRSTIQVREAIGEGVKYDLIGDIVSATGLTRRTVVSILQGIKENTFFLFNLNPEEFIIKVSVIIKDTMRPELVKSITYKKLEGEYSTDIFTGSTLRGKLGVNAIQSTKSLYDLVLVDSVGIEKAFAEELEKEDDVVVYTKLPGRFYINTPLGRYNPDWAVAFREGTVKHIYFVAETKGNSLETSQLRGSEESKIECARRHFAAISSGDVRYGVVTSYKELYDVLTKD
ncbi:MAG: DEAD/DEAH box helicase family protein [Prevotellaceae bacterium]|nr:DEAD/DEAH box helicase family protein [Prevotellaceae bacterium]